MMSRSNSCFCSLRAQLEHPIDINNMPVASAQNWVSDRQCMAPSSILIHRQSCFLMLRWSEEALKFWMVIWLFEQHVSGQRDIGSAWLQTNLSLNIPKIWLFRTSKNFESFTPLFVNVQGNVLRDWPQRNSFLFWFFTSRQLVTSEVLNSVLELFYFSHQRANLNARTYFCTMYMYMQVGYGTTGNCQGLTVWKHAIYVLREIIL